MKKLGLLIIFPVVAYSIYVDFVIFGFSNIGGNPYDLVALICSMAGIFGLCAVIFGKNNILTIGYIAMLVCVAKAIFSFMFPIF